MCGWDTDCNVGNVATIMGVLLGTEAIDFYKWIKPTKDLVICSSVIGSLNIMDIPYGASFIAKMAYDLAGESVPEPFADIINRRIHSAHFEYPKSTHAMRVRTDKQDKIQTLEASLQNTDEAAFSGKRSLKVVVKPVEVTQSIYLYQKTYYRPADFHDSRYDPCFSPILYPGQTITGSVMIPGTSYASFVRMYAKDLRSDELILGERIRLENNGQWATVQARIPPMSGAIIGEAGFLFEVGGERKWRMDFTAFVDDFYYQGPAHYEVDFSKEEVEFWNPLHVEVSQMTRLKGIINLEDKQLNISCSDFAEAYTGHYAWDDYRLTCDITPVIGDSQAVNFRVQGAIYSYAFGFNGKGKLALLKNDNGYSELASCDFDWTYGEDYRFVVEVKGKQISAHCGDKVLAVEDAASPYLTGQIGLSVRNGSRMKVKAMSVEPLKG